MQGLEAVPVFAFAKHHFDFFVASTSKFDPAKKRQNSNLSLSLNIMRLFLNCFGSNETMTFTKSLEKVIVLNKCPQQFGYFKFYDIFWIPSRPRWYPRQGPVINSKEKSSDMRCIPELHKL